MLDQYRKIYVPKFLKAYKDNEKLLKEKELEYEYLLSLSGVDPSFEPVDGGQPSSSVEKIAAERERVERKIKELKEYFRVYNSAMNFLDETEREIIQIYYYQRNPDTVVELKGYTSRTARRIKARAEARLDLFFNE